MAMVFEKFIVTFFLTGAHDGTRHKVVEFDPSGADIAAKRVSLDLDVITWMSAWNAENVRDATGVSTSWITNYTLSEEYTESDAVPSFSGGENVYQEAQMQAILDGKGEKFSTYIASPAPGIFVGDSVNTKQIDTADTAYQTYGSLYVLGGICKLSDGDQWQSPLNVVGSGLRTVRSGKVF